VDLGRIGTACQYDRHPGAEDQTGSVRVGEIKSSWTAAESAALTQRNALSAIIKDLSS